MAKNQNQNQNANDPDILDPEDIVVTIDLDDGSTMDFEIVTIFTVDEQDYIALIPIDENEKIIDGEPVYLYRYNEIDGEYYVDNFESDEEYEKVSKFFDSLPYED